MATKLPTKAQWTKARAYMKGYWSYMYSKWPNGNIPDKNPYVEGHIAWYQFNMGAKKAMLVAQDGEE